MGRFDAGMWDDPRSWAARSAPGGTRRRRICMLRISRRIFLASSTASAIACRTNVSTPASTSDRSMPGRACSGDYHTHRNVTLVHGDAHAWNVFLPRDGGDGSQAVRLGRLADRHRRQRPRLHDGAALVSRSSPAASSGTRIAGPLPRDVACPWRRGYDRQSLAGDYRWVRPYGRWRHRCGRRPTIFHPAFGGITWSASFRRSTIWAVVTCWHEPTLPCRAVRSADRPAG